MPALDHRLQHRLQHRQLEILDKMGIDVWQLRSRQSDENACQIDEQVDNQVDTHGDNHVEDAEADGKSAEPMPEPHSIAPARQPELTVEAGNTLDEVASEINRCQRCPLHATRIKAVAGVGSVQAQWMFVGEAPGQNEDQQGLPFVGRGGQLLDAMIAALQMQRADVFIANVIKCRPPANRDPLPDEIAECEPYLHRQLALVKPKVIVALGLVSAQALLKTSEPLGKLRAQVHHYGTAKTPMIITYHPAYLLRSPGQKSKVWEDLLLARSVVDSV